MRAHLCTCKFGRGHGMLHSAHRLGTVTDRLAFHSTILVAEAQDADMNLMALAVEPMNGMNGGTVDDVDADLGPIHPVDHPKGMLIAIILRHDQHILLADKCCVQANSKQVARTTTIPHIRAHCSLGACANSKWDTRIAHAKSRK